MKKKQNLLLKISLIFGSIALISTTVATAVSCSSSDDSSTQQPQQPSKGSYDKKISEEINTYRTEYNNIIGDTTFFQYTDDNVQQLVSLIDTNLNNLKNVPMDQLSVDGKIWYNSFKDELETKKQLLNSKIHYLIVNSSDQLGFTNYSGWLANRIQYAVNNKENKQTLILFNNFLTKVIKNLKDGLNQNITMSQVMVKHSIGNLLQKPFMKPILDELVKKNGAGGVIFFNTNTINELKTTNPVFTTSNSNDQELVSLLNKANELFFEFLEFITNNYYKNIQYAKSPNYEQYKLNVSTTLTDVEDNGYVYKDTNSTNLYLNGLGLSSADLDVKDIGIGFMKNSNNQGQAIYQALLRKHSNTNKTPTQIFDIGNKGVSEIKNNMKLVAKELANIYAGKNNAWSVTGELYDEDSSGNQNNSTIADNLLQNIVDASGNVDLKKFFIYMNTDKWFNGRDMTKQQFPTIDGQTPILSEYKAAGEKGNPIKNWNGKTIPYKYKDNFTPVNSNITPVKISDVIGEITGTENETLVWGDAGNLAYKYMVLGLSPATIQISNTTTNVTQTKSVSPEAAYIGTSNAILQYLQFKDVSVNHINGAFKDTAVDYTLRTGTGGAAYASSGKGSNSYVAQGDGGFYLDTNPYFGLQKWSMTTLSIHEAVSGHVYQFNYATDHPSVDYAPKFRSTAYAEGWGLFSEWLGVQLGMYGKPTIIDSTNSNKLALPNFGVESKNVNVTQFTNQYDYANGAYWIEDDKSTPEIEQPGNSQKLYDAVQYFGFLNERQLRAMRCAVDVAIHAGGSTMDINGDIADPSSAGQYKPNTGWSLKQARDYLSKNSGLGIDDIKRETKRYLEYTAQAVSYYNGLIVMEDAYLKAKNKFENNHQNQVFLNWSDTKSTQQNTSGLFDIILRNGNVPLLALTDATNTYIENNYN